MGEDIMTVLSLRRLIEDAQPEACRQQEAMRDYSLRIHWIVSRSPSLSENLSLR